MGRDGEEGKKMNGWRNRSGKTIWIRKKEIRK